MRCQVKIPIHLKTIFGPFLMQLSLHFYLVGASTTDKDGLRYLYEGSENFSPIPTFGVILAQEALSQSNMITGGMPGFQVDLSKVCGEFL